jgi:hypothetical protein
MRSLAEAIKEAIVAPRDSFYFATGSGKTEIHLQAIRHAALLTHRAVLRARNFAYLRRKGSRRGLPTAEVAEAP